MALLLHRPPIDSTRIGGAEVYPLLEGGDHLGRELVLRRHRGDFFFMPEHANQGTLVGLVGSENRTGIAASQHAQRRVQFEPAADLLCAFCVALKTMLHQHWFDLLVKNRDPIRIIRLRWRLLAAARRCQHANS